MLYGAIAVLGLIVVAASSLLKPPSHLRSGRYAFHPYDYRLEGLKPGDPPVQQLVIAAGIMRRRIRTLAAKHTTLLVKLIGTKSPGPAVETQIWTSLPSKVQVGTSAAGLAFRWLPFATRHNLHRDPAAVRRDRLRLILATEPGDSYHEPGLRDIAVAVSSNPGDVHSVVFLSGRVFLHHRGSGKPTHSDMQVYHRFRFLYDGTAAKDRPMTREAALLLGPAGPIPYPGANLRTPFGLHGRMLPSLAVPRR